MKLLRYMLGLGLALLAWVAGCGVIRGLGGSLAYGMPIIPHDASVVLEDFSYTPASPIHVGDLITFRATLSKYAKGAYVYVGKDPPGGMAPYLEDFGKNGDAKAGDGVYSRTVRWDSWDGTGDFTITASLTWDDGYPGQQLSAPPLTVLP